jgi:hypothetical protein
MDTLSRASDAAGTDSDVYTQAGPLQRPFVVSIFTMTKEEHINNQHFQPPSLQGALHSIFSSRLLLNIRSVSEQIDESFSYLTTYEVNALQGTMIELEGSLVHDPSRSEGVPAIDV